MYHKYLFRINNVSVERFVHGLSKYGDPISPPLRFPHYGRYFPTGSRTTMLTVRRFSSPLSWFRGIGKAMWNVYRGDDHINPKKILERKYIYLALMAIQFRQLRLLEENKGHNTFVDNDVIYDKAVEELDKLNLDKTTNVDLRLLLQKMIRPQIRDVFQVFDQIDQQLNIPQSIETHVVSNQSIMDDTVFINTYRNLLLCEHERTRQLLSEIQMLDKNNNNNNHSQISFLTTKEEAIASLLQYHGWCDFSDTTTTDTSPTTSNDIDNVLDPFGMSVSDSRDDTIRLVKQYQTINICRSALIRDNIGYSVLSLRSSIPGAGRGLYIDGSVTAGAIVAFQPGDVWPKEHTISNAPEVIEHFAGDDDDCQISLRFDDYVVDSRNSPVVVLCRDGSLNPWALGNMVNHPTPPSVPNCQSVMLNYTANAKLDKLVRYIPNSYAKVPTWQSTFFDLEEVILHGLCLLSRKNVQNEELFYDYRLQSETTPDWYTIVKYENQLEDDQVVFFRDDWRNKQ
jgi:hypothetical protein